MKDKFEEYYDREIDNQFYKLIQELAFLKMERDEYIKLFEDMRKKYRDLLQESTSHSQYMSAMMLNVALNGGFSTGKKNER